MTSLSHRLRLPLILVCLVSGRLRAQEATYTSESFRLRTDIKERNAKRVLDALERARPAHLTAIGLRDAAIGRMDITVFKSRAAFNAVGRRYGRKVVGAVGATTPDGILAYYGTSRARCVGVLMHELTHAYLRAAGVRVAPWLNEGLACYFGGVRRAGGRLTFGVPHEERLMAAVRAMRANRHVPLKKLLRLEKKHFYLGRRADGQPNPQERLVYGEAMTLVHFLKRSKHEAVAGKFERFLAQAYESGDTRQAFESIYGSDYARLERAWRAHTLGLVT